MVEGDVVGECDGPDLIVDHTAERVWCDEEGRLPLVSGDRLLELRVDERWVGDDGTPGLAYRLGPAKSFNGEPEKDLIDELVRDG